MEIIMFGFVTQPNVVFSASRVLRALEMEICYTHIR